MGLTASKGARAYMNITVGTYTIVSTTIFGVAGPNRLPTGWADGDVLYGYNDYGYDSGTLAGIPFGSISGTYNFNSYILTTSPTSLVRQIIYNSTKNTSLIRISNSQLGASGVSGIAAYWYASTSDTSPYSSAVYTSLVNSSPGGGSVDYNVSATWSPGAMPMAIVNQTKKIGIFF